MKHSILGDGKVGSALDTNLVKECSRVVWGPEWVDSQQMFDTDVLDIAFPYTKNFIEIVMEAIRRFQPKYLVIHSTVKPGTTAAIDHNRKIYTPFMGRHDDNIAKSSQAYNKFLAGDKEHCDAIYRQYGYINTEYWGTDYNSLEYAKIMSTTTMYWELILQKIMRQDCNKHGFDFNLVYTKWLRNYNKGMLKYHPEWQRPIYDYVDDPIPGGHCLIPNIELFDNFITHICRLWTKHKGKITLMDIT